MGSWSRGKQKSLKGQKLEKGHFPQAEEEERSVRGLDWKPGPELQQSC